MQSNVHLLARMALVLVALVLSLAVPVHGDESATPDKTAASLPAGTNWSVDNLTNPRFNQLFFAERPYKLTLKGQLMYFSRPHNQFGLLMSPNAAMVIDINLGRTVRQVPNLRIQSPNVVLSHDGRRLAAEHQQSVMVVELTPQRGLASIPVPAGNSPAWMAFTTNDTLLIRWNNIAEVQAYDVVSGNLKWRYSNPGLSKEIWTQTSHNHLIALAIQAHGSAEPAVVLLDAETGSEKGQIALGTIAPGDSYSIMNLSIDPRNRFLAILGMNISKADPRLMLYNLATGEPLWYSHVPRVLNMFMGDRANQIDARAPLGFFSERYILAGMMFFYPVERSSSHINIQLPVRTADLLYEHVNGFSGMFASYATAPGQSTLFMRYFKDDEIDKGMNGPKDPAKQSTKPAAPSSAKAQQDSKPPAQRGSTEGATIIPQPDYHQPMPWTSLVDPSPALEVEYFNKPIETPDQIDRVRYTKVTLSSDGKAAMLIQGVPMGVSDRGNVVPAFVDLTTGQTIASSLVLSPGSRVLAFNVELDRALCTDHRSPGLYMREIRSGKYLSALNPVLTSNEEILSGNIKLATIVDADHVVIATMEEIGHWSMTEGKLLWATRNRADIHPLLSPGGKYIMHRYSGQLMFVDVRTGQYAGRIELIHGSPREFDLSADGRYLYQLSNPLSQATLFIYDLETGKLASKSFVPNHTLMGFQRLDDEFVMSNNYIIHQATGRIVGELKSEVIPVSQYRSARTWALGQNEENIPVLFMTQIPDAQTRQKLAQSLQEPPTELKAGMRISLQLDIPERQMTQVVKDLQAKGYAIDPNGPYKLVEEFKVTDEGIATASVNTPNGAISVNVPRKTASRTLKVIDEHQRVIWSTSKTAKTNIDRIRSARNAESALRMANGAIDALQRSNYESLLKEIPTNLYPPIAEMTIEPLSLEVPQ